MLRDPQMNALHKIALVTTLVMSATAGAQTINQASLTVNVSLTAQCKVASTTAGSGINYTAFQATDATGTYASVTYECTRGIALSSIAFDTTNGTNSSSASTSPSATAAGVVAGLKYDLNTGTPTRTAGTAATNAATGSGDTVAYTVAYTIPKEQAGQAGSGGAGGNNQSVALARTLTLSY